MNSFPIRGILSTHTNFRDYDITVASVLFEVFVFFASFVFLYVISSLASKNSQRQTLVFWFFALGLVSQAAVRDCAHVSEVRMISNAIDLISFISYYLNKQTFIYT